MKSLTVPFFISHQGCPHRCIFCNQQKISGAAGEFPSPAEMLAKIAAYRASGRRNSVDVAFFGGTFTALPFEVQEGLLLPLQPLIADGTVEAIRLSTRPDAMNNAIARFLQESGVKTVEFGVQSMCDEILDRCGRGHTAADMENACRIVKGAGISVGIQLMPGLPGDSRETSLVSLQRALSLKPDFLRIYPTLVIAGTDLERLCKSGSYRAMSLAEAVHLCKVMLHVSQKAGIPVIRLGLQATEELNADGVIVAGPYHPAFRQLVEGELYYDLLLKLAAGLPDAAEVILRCAPRKISDVAGQRRNNIQRLFREKGVKVTAIKADPLLSLPEVRMESGNISRKGSLLEDLHYAPEVTGHV